MLKWILFIVIGYLILQYWKRQQAPRPGPRTGGRRRPAVERMVACKYCDVHLPESECIRDASGQPYCCEDHRRLGPR